MSYKDVVQPNGWKQRMLELAAGIMCPYYAIHPASSVVLTSVAASATNVTLKAANAARRGLMVVNDSDKDLYLKYGATATASDYSVKIPMAGYWEMPQPIYTGIVDAVWAAGPTGSAKITEST